MISKKLYTNIINDLYIRGRPELSAFSQAYTEYAGGGGSMVAVCYFNFFNIMHCIFIGR